MTIVWNVSNGNLDLSNPSLDIWEKGYPNKQLKNLRQYNSFIWGNVYEKFPNKMLTILFRFQEGKFPVFYCHFGVFKLTHWVTHICVSKLTIIGSDNGLSPGRRQAIVWINAGILLIEPLGTNFSEIYIEIRTFSLKKMHLKVSSSKWRPFCLGPSVLTWPQHKSGHVTQAVITGTIILVPYILWQRSHSLLTIPKVLRSWYAGWMCWSKYYFLHLPSWNLNLLRLFTTALMLKNFSYSQLLSSWSEEFH